MPGEVLDTRSSYDVSPLGALLTHHDIGAVPGYNPDNGTACWKAIVTAVRRDMEPGSPYLFSIVSGLAETHTQIAKVAGLEEEPSYSLPELGGIGIYLRLEADERLNRAALENTLFADISYSIGAPNVSALQIGASLLQAARCFPPAFNTPYDAYRISTKSMRGRSYPGFWYITDGRHLVPAG